MVNLILDCSCWVEIKLHTYAETLTEYRSVVRNVCSKHREEAKKDEIEQLKIHLHNEKRALEGKYINLKEMIEIADDPFKETRK